MRDTGQLTESQYRASVDMPLRSQASAGAVAAASKSCGGYFQEEVRRELVARFGGQQVLQGGLRVYTGYDSEMQCAAEQTITSRIEQIAKNRKAARDLEGSLVALDPASGEVRALVGGRDFGATSYIRATQAHRQPGSAFKPIIYAAALERGMAPASMLHHLDEPIMTDNGPWLPSGEHEQPDYSLRTALKISSNRAAAQLLQQVGYSQATYYAQRMGIESRLPAVASLALGTGGVTLLELTSAYGVFANQGVAVSPHLIVRVEDHNGTTIWDGGVGRHQAVTPATAYLMSSMLADVITSGTATTARAAGFKLPAAGKDRHDRQLHRRLVHRLHAAPRDRRVVRHGQARADHEPRLRRRRGGAGVGGVHEAGDGEGRARLVPAARGRREDHDLPPERTARHRCVPSRMDGSRLRAGGPHGAAGHSRR